MAKTRRLVELVLTGKDESKNAFRSMEESFKGLIEKHVTLTGKQAFLAAGTLAVAAGMAKAAKEIYDFTARMAEAGDRAAKLSYRLGLTVEGLSELEYIAKSGGVPVNQMAMAMQRMTRRMSEAAKGTGEAKDAIKELGIDAMQLTLLSPDQQFYQIAEALQAVTGQSDRLRLAFKLFDSEGVAVLQTLKRDLRESRNEFELFGGAMSAAFAGKSEQFTQSHTNLSNATDRLKEALAEPFLTPFTDAINKLAEAIATGQRDVAGSGDKSAWSVAGGYAATAFSGPGAVVGGAWQDIGTRIGRHFGPPTPRGYGAGDPFDDYYGGYVPPPLPSAQAPGGPRNYSSSFVEYGHLQGLPETWQNEAYARGVGADYSGLSDSDFMFPEVDIDSLTVGMGQMSQVLDQVNSQAVAFGSSFAGSVTAGLGRALTSAENFSDIFSAILESAFSSGLGMLGSLGFNALFPGAGAVVDAATKSAPSGAGLKSMPLANTYAGGGYI